MSQWTSFKINHCCSRPLSQALSSLMAEMGAVLDLHSGPAVLEAAARTYLSLCGEDTTWCSTARAARDSLVQAWVDRLTVLLEGSLRVRRAVTLCGQKYVDVQYVRVFLKNKLMGHLILLLCKIMNIFLIFSTCFSCKILDAFTSPGLKSVK